MIQLQTETERRDLNGLVGESLDETITALLSGEVLKSLYEHLEKVHSISREQVPSRLEVLHSTLRTTFGPAGSKTITRMVAKRLYGKLGLAFVDPLWNPGPTLIEYVEEAKVKLKERAGQP